MPTQPIQSNPQDILMETLYDLQYGEEVTVRGVHSGRHYTITQCDPFIGPGKVHVYDTAMNALHVESIPDLLDCFELVDIEVSQWMVSVDGMQAPSKVHDSYGSAKQEQDRLARKHVGNRVRLLKLDSVIQAKQRLELVECH